MTSKLTFAITSLEKEAKPVGYVLVVGEGTPRGAAQSRRRAQRPVAHFSFLWNQDQMGSDKGQYRTIGWSTAGVSDLTKGHYSTDTSQLSLFKIILFKNEDINHVHLPHGIHF